MERTLKLVVAYDGTEFHGWQRQEGLRTVEETLAAAVGSLCGRVGDLHGASRTDRGVHALGQTVSARVESAVPTARLARALNGRLPADLRVVRAEDAPEGFHARHHAAGKRYRYSIDVGEPEDVLRARYALHYPHRLDLEAMRSGARCLVGEHDFASFQCTGSQPTAGTIRTLAAIDVLARGREVWIEVEGRSFLYKMVRTLAGTLLEVGRGRWPPARVTDVLRARDRRQAGPTLCGHGLCLLEVFYAACPSEGRPASPGGPSAVDLDSGGRYDSLEL